METFVCYNTCAVIHIFSMKFLVIAPTPFFTSRGTHIRILEESLALERRGHTITIATYHIGNPIPDRIVTRIDVRRIRRWLFWYKKFEAGPDWQKIILDIMLLRKVFFLARTEYPHILYAHLHEGVLIAKVVQKLLWWRKIIVIADFHGSLTGEMKSHGYLRAGVLKTIFVWLEKKINGLGNIAVASSWEYARTIDESRPAEKMTEVLLDGVNIQNYIGTPSRVSLRDRFNLPRNKTIFVYSGAFLGNKGIITLLDTIREIVSHNHTTAHFVLAGSPPGSIEGLLGERGLTSAVTLICPLDYFEMPHLLSACDVGIDPKDSTTAQASGKILQYMAAGLPVLCFDRDNNRRYLGDGGYYIRDFSSQGLAQGVWEILKNADDLLDKGRMNFQRATQFSWDNGAKKIEELVAVHDGTFAPKSVSVYTKEKVKF